MQGEEGGEEEQEAPEATEQEAAQAEWEGGLDLQLSPEGEVRDRQGRAEGMRLHTARQVRPVQRSTEAWLPPTASTAPLCARGGGGHP